MNPYVFVTFSDDAAKEAAPLTIQRIVAIRQRQGKDYWPVLMNHRKRVEQRASSGQPLWGRGRRPAEMAGSRSIGGGGFVDRAARMAGSRSIGGGGFVDRAARMAGTGIGAVQGVAEGLRRRMQ